MDEANVSHTFLGEKSQATMHLSNIILLWPNHDKMPYKPWKRRPARVYHLKVFDKKCYIRRNHENIGKFDS